MNWNIVEGNWKQFKGIVKAHTTATQSFQIGALIQVGPEGLIRWLAVTAIALTAVNMFGGFAVTQRMLQMFRK